MRQTGNTHRISIVVALRVQKLSCVGFNDQFTDPLTLCTNWLNYMADFKYD